MDNQLDNREVELDYVSSKAQFLWAHQALAALTVFVCAGFTASASWALLGFGYLSDTEAGGPSTVKLGVKAVIFSAIFAASIVWLRTLCRRRPERFAPQERPAPSGRRATTIALLVSLAVAALAVLPRLSVYPHIEPDESHHLIVARNVAMHGVYGSGMPATGFRPFDDYDSVGPTVLLPVAAAIGAFGDPVHSGRMTMAIFFVLLCTVVYLLTIPSFGAWGAAVAVLFMLAAPGSLYLARTLYGEPPALAFLIAGILVWERALSAKRQLLLAIVSGFLLGGALVTKYFLVVAAWPALGMWIYDRMTHRRIRPLHAIVPASSALAVLVGWIAITSIFGPQGTDTAGGHLSMYRHNLLFGIGSVDATLSWLLQHWIAAVICLAGVYSAAVAAMYVAYRPSYLFLALFAALILFWWAFFTTGAIPRYVWYALALGAAFAGASCTNVRRTWAKRPVGYRWLCYAIPAAMMSLAAWDTWPRFVNVATRDEMKDEYALVDRLKQDYRQRTVATTFYPLERVANLLAEIPVHRIGETHAWNAYDAVVVDAQSQPELASRPRLAARAGRYVIIEPGNAAP